MAADAGAVWLEIAPLATKCVSDEIQSNVVVIGDYYVLYEHHHAHLTVSVKVTSPFGDTVHQREKVSVDQFAFTSAEAVNYLLASRLMGVELELVKLETAVQGIHENLLLLRSKEADMRDVNEKTNARISWLSMMSLSVCIIVPVLQLWHLQQYFRKKKLI